MLKVSLIFEFFVPNYRYFVLDWLKSRARLFVVCAEDKFEGSPPVKCNVLSSSIGSGETRLYFFNPMRLLSSDVIITTFNLRRPHTWVFVFLFPWKKWIFWGQGIWSNTNSIVNFFRKLILSISDGYIVYTPEGKRNLIQEGYPVRKISVAYNTLNVENNSITFGSDYLLFVGRVQKRKSIELIFPYLRELDLKLRIVGDGEYREELKRLSLKLGVDQYVEFFPATFSDELLFEHFKGAIAYYTPTQLGLGVVHAFAYGVPVLTLKNEIHGPEFWYCNHENSYLYESLESLVAGVNNMDTESEQHMKKREAAYDCYRRSLSPDNVYEAFEFHLNKLT